jgi:integrase
MTKVMGMRFQRGYVFKVGRSWYGRWRRDELEEGADGSKIIVRRQHAEKLCAVSDKYRTKKDVQNLLDEKLVQLNAERKSPESRMSTAASTLTIAAYWADYFLPFAKRELKPSTIHGYQALWKMYLGPRLADTIIGDFRCVTATQLLAAIHEEHKLGKATLKHCKALLSSICKHAKQGGVLDGENPVKDAGIPRAAVAGKPTHASSPTEVMAMLGALKGVARTAIALMFFCGLRPGEARAVEWRDYDEKKKTLRIRSSLWRGHMTAPKTPDSVATQVVPDTLGDILAESPRSDGYILKSPLGKPIDLYNLTSRVIVPALTLCANCQKEKAEHDAIDHEFQPLPKWRGFYAFRRGIATLATSVDSQLAAKSLLRHSNISTTQSHYIKSVPEDALRAATKIDALFKSAENAIPN